MKNRMAAAPYLVWMVLFIIVPLALVIVFAFTDTSGNFTFDNFSSIVDLGRIFLRSFWLALLSSVICLLLGYPVAYTLSRMRRRRQGLVLMLLILPMWMNFLLRTYSLILLIDTNGLINQLLQSLSLPTIKIINTQFAVLIGMVYNYLPFMILPIYSILIKIERNVVEAAEDLGANPFQVFRKVTLPLSMPGVMSGIIMVFVPAVSTFIISKMLGGGMFMLIGDYIEMQFLGNTYNPGVGSAISLILMVIILISLFFMRGMDEETKEGILG
jgi:spermidine/putrescine transport system permease protein